MTWINERLAPLSRSDGLNGWPQAALLLIALGAIASRSPGLVLHPQFYAEDGRIWYAQAYNLGPVPALALPYAGYLNLFPRLVAALSLLVPLAAAPGVMLACGALCQAFPVTLLLSARCAPQAALPMRAAMALAYVALPNSQETHLVLTSAQWHLALLSILLLLANPPEVGRQRLFDLTVFALCGWTGPFCLALLPVALAIAWRRRARWSFAAAAVLGVAAVCQAAVLLHGRAERPSATQFGATISLFARLLSGQVFVGALWGSNDFGHHAGPAAVAVMTVLGLTALGFCLGRASFELRCFLLFSALVFACSLASPLVSSGGKQWEALLRTSGCRYWFFPALAFIWSLLWCARQRAVPSLAAFSMALLTLAVVGAARDWRDEPFDTPDFASSLQRFEAAPPGARVTFPILPAGWTMALIKRP